MTIIDDSNIGMPRTTQVARAANALIPTNAAQESEQIKRNLLISLNTKLDKMIELATKQIAISEKHLQLQEEMRTAYTGMPEVCQGEK